MSLATLSLLAPKGLPEIVEGADLAELISSALEDEALPLEEGDVVVLAQKVVSKAEGRTRLLSSVKPSERALELSRRCGKDPRIVEFVLQESTEVVRCVPGVLIVEHRLGFVTANAGIDQSNVPGADGDERVLLLPVDPDFSAGLLSDRLSARFGVRVAVVINDSWGRAWRIGTVGTAIGVAGIGAVSDLRGKPDRIGRRLVTTEVGHADEIAAAASLLMGQAAEGRPVVVVRGLVHVPGNGSGRDLLRPKDKDLFR